jgi:carbohydrate-binding DOMON domain-containing protein
MKKRFLFSLTMIYFLYSFTVFGQTVVEFKDPSGDDNGPGTYNYPTDAVYTKGSFDLTSFTIKNSIDADRLDFSATVAANLDDVWKTGNGFSVQMIFIFIDTDRKSGSGFTEGPPGLNIWFAPSDAWDKCIILSPQTASRVKKEVGQKMSSAQQYAVIVPSRVKGAGNTITASISAGELGRGDPATWGYQVVMQANEGFPAGNDLLTRRVNEFEGMHRFGGGHDENCDPHVLDLFAGKGIGDKSEIALQHRMLAFECGPDGASKKWATLTMVRK